MVHLAKLGRRDARGRTERPREGAVIGEAARVRDLGDGARSIAEGQRGGGDARLGDQLDGSEAEDPLDDASEPGRRHPREAGEPGRRDGLRVVGFQVQDGRGDFRLDLPRRNRRTHVFREADQAADFPRLVTQRKFGCQAPDRAVGQQPVELEVVDDGAPGAQHGCILFGRDASEAARANVRGASPNHLRLALKAVAFHQRMVHGGVAAVGVFDEKGDVRRVIEQLLQQLAVDAGHRVSGNFACRADGIGGHVIGGCGGRLTDLIQLSRVAFPEKFQVLLTTDAPG